MKIHVVQKGDTLWELAKHYQVDFEELKQMNPQLSSPDMIMPGMKIKIPGTAKSVQKEHVKETQKKGSNQPQKEMQQAKPIPVIHDDEKEKEAQMQPHMPMQPNMPPQQPSKPQQPQPQQPMQPQMPMPQPAPQQPTQEHMQPIIQMPIMDQELNNYTSVTVPNPPAHQAKPKEQPKKQTEKHPAPAPMPMPHPVPIMPVCCHMWPHQAMPPHPMPGPGMGIAPGCMPNQQMNHPCHPMFPMGIDQSHMYASSPIEVPAKPSLSKDCGCQGSKAKSHQQNQWQNVKPQANWNRPSSNSAEYSAPQPTVKYPGYGYPNPESFSADYVNRQATQPFPTPPGYMAPGTYREDGDGQS